MVLKSTKPKQKNMETKKITIKDHLNGDMDEKILSI
jgi:hypothetical protein